MIVPSIDSPPLLIFHLIIARSNPVILQVLPMSNMSSVYPFLLESAQKLESLHYLLLLLLSIESALHLISVPGPIPLVVSKIQTQLDRIRVASESILQGECKEYLFSQ